MKLTKDIIAQIERDFGRKAEAAIRYLQGPSAPSFPGPRVLRCVIFLAEGEIGLLPKLLDVAQTDYRDVIFWAEYIRHETERPIHVRNFNRAFGRHKLKTKASPEEGPRLPKDVKRFLAAPHRS
jgi:hypothetical protein